MEADYLAHLPDSIQHAILRHHHRQDRQAMLFGKLLLQHAHSLRAANLKESFLERLEYTETGKPFIRGETGFNISHSGNIVVLALVDDGSVDIDVERILTTGFDDLSSYLPEIAELESGDARERLSMLYDCWTRKEAVLKGIGSGLQIPLEQVNLSGDRALINDKVWHLQKIDCGAGYMCNAATS